MKVVEDRRMWNMARESRIKGERTERLRAKKEEIDRIPVQSEDKRGREYEERGETRKTERGVRYDGERSYGHDREGSREKIGGYERERSMEYKGRSHDVERDRSPVGREDRRREGSYGDISGVRVEVESRQSRVQVYRERTSPRRERVVEFSSEEVEEVTRSGNFDNWSTAMVKADTMDSSMASTSSKPVSNTSQQKSVSEEVDRLHKKVATKVMKYLNKYYPGAEEFEPAEHKISSPEEYSSLAKEFSHKLRQQIKESYELYHSTLEGIVLTGDNEQSIRTEVESYFEGIPRVR